MVVQERGQDVSEFCTFGSHKRTILPQMSRGALSGVYCRTMVVPNLINQEVETTLSSKSKQEGFILIERLVVIATIGPATPARVE